MGYRSDVALCLNQNAIAFMRSNLAKSSMETRENIDGLFAMSECHYSDPFHTAEIWSWKDIKWYSDYEEIGIMESIMNELDVKDYLFIRIGESDDDSQIEGCYYDNPFGMYLSRVIEFAKPKEISHESC